MAGIYLKVDSIMRHTTGHRTKDGVYENSTFSPLSTATGSPVIINSHILGNSVVSDKAEVLNSIVLNSIIADNAVIENVIMIGCTVVGSARVLCKDTTTIQNCIIEEGFWHRSPISYTLPTGVTITEGIDDKVVVDCTNNRISKWLGGAGRIFGRIKGYTEEEMDMIEYYIKQIEEIKKCIIV